MAASLSIRLMKIGSRTRPTDLVRTTLGVSRFSQMSANNIRIEFDKNARPFGQFVARVCIVQSDSLRPTTRTLYGSATRVNQDEEVHTEEPYGGCMTLTCV